MGKLDGKVAIVTGATSGIGRATSELLAAEGAALVLSGRDQARGDEVRAGIEARAGRAVFLAGDVAEAKTHERLVALANERFGGVDILVCNAGVLGLGSVTDVPLEVWRRTLAVNLDAAFYLCRYGIPELQRRGAGSVIVVSSIGAFKGFPNHAAYCASKGALVALMRQMAKEYAPAVRVNAVCPGPVDTPLIWDSAAAFPDPARAVAAAGTATALGRLGSPVDVANAVLFLASDASSWVTGSELTVDGGIRC